MTANLQRWQSIHDQLRRMMEEQKVDDAYWPGRLSDSALATATAVCALSLSRVAADQPLIEKALKWLERTQNFDGGWGDSPGSPSNLPASLLVLAAYKLAEKEPPPSAASYVEKKGGADAIEGLYGADRTFSVPILTCCAIAGLADWPRVPQLPLELAALPRSTFHLLGLPVVSYALPALIAMGLCRHKRLPSPNPLMAYLRQSLTPLLLHKLERLQPDSGGFLEAIPLTAFVAMSLISAGFEKHPAVARCQDFLRGCMREDGCWPIDCNLSVWNTCMAVWARGACDELTRDWLIDRQQKSTHPYTGAAAGGWGWSHLSGSVPDTDDTAGALIALGLRTKMTPELARAAMAAVQWLLDVQNRDGGWPTFCRGWGKLEFDRSGCDLTAHAAAALTCWRERLMREIPSATGVGKLCKRVEKAFVAALEFLAINQRADGSWPALWFGSQFTPDNGNPVFGTARVLRGLRQMPLAKTIDMYRRGRNYLISAAHDDGSFGAAAGIRPTIEETAAALEALAQVHDPENADLVARAGDWLCDRIEAGGLDTPSPIGLYFARLWYHEKLYPLTLATAALRQVTAIYKN